MAHTHTGRIVATPRRRGGRGFDHLNAADGPARLVHALTRSGRDYKALCGVTVLARYGDDDDLDGPVTGHVTEGIAGVTCLRCRKVIG